MSNFIPPFMMETISSFQKVRHLYVLKIRSLISLIREEVLIFELDPEPNSLKVIPAFNLKSDPNKFVSTTQPISQQIYYRQWISKMKRKSGTLLQFKHSVIELQYINAFRPQITEKATKTTIMVN
jgi:hypothetical protein